MDIAIRANCSCALLKSVCPSAAGYIRALRGNALNFVNTGESETVLSLADFAYPAVNGVQYTL